MIIDTPFDEMCSFICLTSGSCATNRYLFNEYFVANEIPSIRNNNGKDKEIFYLNSQFYLLSSVSQYRMSATKEFNLNNFRWAATQIKSDNAV